ncbi:aldo/keto reductase [Actinoplanes sp. CA-051413]|uniref:aldo/keto reductase n=1 Tax=Actinoplanes sp. CA-051413 TaxID=3239899 RepID=UPI003D989934
MPWSRSWFPRCAPRRRADSVQSVACRPAGGALESAVSDDRVEAHRDQLEAYEALCRELGAKPAAVALAWLLRNPVVSSTIVGAMTIEELRADLGALSVDLDDAVMRRLDQIWPGPGEAPQAHAW